MLSSRFLFSFSGVFPALLSYLSHLCLSGHQLWRISWPRPSRIPGGAQTADGHGSVSVAGVALPTLSFESDLSCWESASPFVCWAPARCTTVKEKPCNDRNHHVTLVLEYRCQDSNWRDTWSMTRVKCRPARWYHNYLMARASLSIAA